MEGLKPKVNTNGTFENPFSTWTGLPSFWQVLKFMRDKRAVRAKLPSQDVIEQSLPIVKPSAVSLENPPRDRIQYVWIGHATVLVQMNGINILTDPIFSDRCSPFSFMGPRRYRPPPLSIDELPRIDLVLISHNHYDHLDVTSVKSLNARFGKALRWMVPMNLRAWFISTGCENVVEQSWWDTTRHKEDDSTEIICTPAQHWSLRNGFDRNKSLWCSWVVKSPSHRFFFSGDTGYCEAFKAIGEKLGPFDLAAVAIGAYEPRYFMAPQHIDPQQAYQVHLDLKCKLSVGIHWGTFPMGSVEPYMEPKQLIESLQKDNPDVPPFITVTHGSVNVV